MRLGGDESQRKGGGETIAETRGVEAEKTVCASEGLG